MTKGLGKPPLTSGGPDYAKYMQELLGSLAPTNVTEKAPEQKRVKAGVKSKSAGGTIKGFGRKNARVIK